MSYFKDVVDWHRAVGHPVASLPQHDKAQEDSTDLVLGWKLVQEEYKELLDAETLEDIADGIGDSIWVLCGLAARLGVNLDEVWNEIRRANNDKLGGPVRADGKQLKPWDWQPPDIERALKVPIGQSVRCKFCKELVPAKDAHAHLGEYVGDCCWDERLRITE